MIRLTDEEILRSMGTNSVDCLDCGMHIEQFHISNKAQLKKVVEYIKNKAEIDCGYGDTHTSEMVLIQMLEKDWQALLEEIK